MLKHILLAAAVASVSAGCEFREPQRQPDMMEELRTRSLAAPPARRLTPNFVTEAAPPRTVRAPQVYRGRDVSEFTRRGVSVPFRPSGDGYELSFNNADLQEVVQVILGDILGRPYVIDPRVEGTATLSTAGPINAADLLAALETVLRGNGAALVPTGEGFAIMPAIEAAGGATIVQLGGDPNPLPVGYGITIVPLRNVSAETLGPLITPIANPERVRIDAARNLVVVTGPGQERQSIAETIAAFDVDWMRGRSVGIFPLRQASPEAVIRELQAVYGGAPEGGPLQGQVQFLPVERLNAVMVVSSQPGRLRDAEDWIARLDQGDTEDEQIFVYHVQNGAASNLARVLGLAFGRLEDQGLEGLPDTGGTIAPSLDPTLRASQPASRLGQGGTLSDATGATPGLSGAGRSDGVGGQQTFAPINFDRQATEADASILGLADLPQSAVFELDRFGEVRVVADRNSNALLIRARPAAFRMIEGALRAIDATPSQVVIEATVAEVTLTDRLRYGVQYFLSREDLNVGFTSRVGLLPVATTPGFNLIYAANSARVILDALSAVTTVNIVSTPTLAVLNNQTAQLQVGDQVPIITQQAQSILDSDAPIINSVEYRDTGVILTVTPRINSNDQVNMEVQQEVSNVNDAASSDTTAGTTSPTIATRRIGSVVSVASGQTVVLGGLISSNRTDDSAGIPVLKDIPILGALFSTTLRDRRRTELIVLITPRVVKSPGDAQAIAEEMRRRMRSLQPDERTRPRPL